MYRYSESEDFTKLSKEDQAKVLKFEAQKQIKNEQDRDKVNPVINIDTEHEKNREQFPGFKENDHLLLIGPSGTGKTTWVVTQLCENWFANFEKFVYVGPSNTQASVNQLFMGAKVDLTINKGKNIETLNVEHYYYEHQGDMDLVLNKFKSKQKEKTLLFMDDVQSAPKIYSQLKSLVIKAKNSNMTLILTIHDNQQDDTTKAFRSNCNYYVFFRPNPHVIKVFTNSITADDLMTKIHPLYNEHQILIYDKLNSEFYFGTGKKLKVFGKQVKPFEKINSNNDGTTTE